jgi:malate dehydrogenase (quinone)
VVLVGAGIMSATLAVFLKELEPALNLEMFENLDGAGEESSDAWNNAGTGHAALCELNYTPERGDGSIDISKALDVNVESLPSIVVLPRDQGRNRRSAFFHPSVPVSLLQ